MVPCFKGKWALTPRMLLSKGFGFLLGWRGRSFFFMFLGSTVPGEGDPFSFVAGAFAFVTGMLEVGLGCQGRRQGRDDAEIDQPLATEVVAGNKVNPGGTEASSHWADARQLHEVHVSADQPASWPPSDGQVCDATWNVLRPARCPSAIASPRIYSTEGREHLMAHGACTTNLRVLSGMRVPRLALAASGKLRGRRNCAHVQSSKAPLRVHLRRARERGRKGVDSTCCGASHSRICGWLRCVSVA